MMRKNKKFVPKRRFKEFKNADAWEKRKLGEYGYFYYGKSAPKWSVTNDATTPCIRYGELYTKYGAKIDKIFSFTNIETKNLKFSNGTEVLIPRVGENPLDFANCSWLSVPDVAIGEMISVYNTKENPLFVSYYFNSQLKYEFARRVEGGNVSNLYYTYLEEIDISFPEWKEQTMIANFFEKLDNVITLHQHKLEKMKVLKIAYLSEMFPDEGKSNPKRRFKDFTSAWVQEKMEQVITINSGRDYKHLNKGDIPVYGTGGYMLSVDEALSECKDAIGIGRKGTIDKPYLLKAPFWTVDTLFYTIPKADFHLQFVLAIFEKINWKQLDESTGVPSLSKTIINKVIISVPDYKEQSKMGQFFQQLNMLMGLYQRKIEKVRNIKKAYLNEMFIGGD